jgi:hypothetical protein
VIRDKLLRHYESKVSTFYDLQNRCFHRKSWDGYSMPH